MEAAFILFGKRDHVAARAPDRGRIAAFATRNPHRFTATRAHDVDLLRAGPIRFEHDLAAIRAEAGRGFNRRRVGQLVHLTRADIHRVNVRVAALFQRKHHRIAIRAKARREGHRAGHLAQIAGFQASHIHQIDRRKARGVRGEQNPITIRREPRRQHDAAAVGQILHIRAIVIHHAQTLLALIFRAAFRDIDDAAVKIRAFAGDPAIHRIRHLVRHPPPALRRAGKLQAIAQRLPRGHIIQPELHHNAVAARLHRAGDQGLGVDRLPIRIGNRRIKRGDAADIGILRRFDEQPGPGQIGRDNAGDIGGIIARPAFVDEIRHREGHRLDHRAVDGDVQFGLGRQRHQTGKPKQKGRG
ncbi:MAG: hypothetical protein ACD_54C00355G0001 [uncultured bacterium]|nr:MAG: hypothetical protein ACD_54C00355G0001 [uncultured bacterium]